MDKWKMLFSNHILVRGWDYYQSGRVYDVKPTAQGIQQWWRGRTSMLFIFI